jgi:tetratricopeptide (TPR) repeat protein
LKVVFVGGAQALRLALAYVRRDDESADCGWMPDRAVESAQDVETLRAAETMVWLGSGEPRIDREALEFGGEWIALPELHMEFLWPFAGQPHIANTPDDLFPDGPFPADLGDAWLNRALEGQSRPEAIAERYLALDVARAIDLDRIKDFALERQAKHDKLLGVDLVSRIADGFRHRPLFLSPRTPGSELFDLLAAAVFARLGVAYPGEAAPPAARELPIHPRVAAHYGLDAALAQPCAQGWGEPVDFAEYVHRYLSYAEGPELERGLALTGQDRFEEAAQALEVAAARPMGRRSRSARRGLARARLLAAGVPPNDVEAVDLEDAQYATARAAFARGRWSEAQSALLAYLARSPARPEDFERLADIRDKLGDAEGAFAALELAAGLKPDDPALARRLTLALAARGEWLAAMRSAEREITLAPSNPHPRAFLADIQTRAGWPSRAAALGEARE